MKRTFSTDQMNAALARAELHGEGQRVIEIWHAAAEGRLTADDQAAWLELVSHRILDSQRGETPVQKRLSRLREAMTISGLCEPVLDRTIDPNGNSVGYEWSTLHQAMEDELRAAGETIWRLIHSNRATQTIRELWLDFVAHRMCAVIDEYDGDNDDAKRVRAAKANQRGNRLLWATVLAGGKPRTDPLEMGSKPTDQVTMHVRDLERFRPNSSKEEKEDAADRLLKAAEEAGIGIENPSPEKVRKFKTGLAEKRRVRPI